MGYTNARYYPGGLEDWEQGGRAFESGAPTPPPHLEDRAGTPGSAPVASIGARAGTPGNSRRWTDLVVDTLGQRSIGWLLGLWVWMIVVFGFLYWGAAFTLGHGLRSTDGMVDGDFPGFLTAVYFSFVTALSIGYGDVVPEGPFRLLAVLEGAAGLILFGAVISRLVSRRQEELTAEIHRITNEDRLDRVRTNLHLVLSDLQAIVAKCADPAIPPERILTRLESTTAVFAGELHTVHDLLYRPQQAPEEEELEVILACLAANLRELTDCLACLDPARPRSPILVSSVRNVSTRAAEICGECVPREYAPHLRAWMDRIQALAGRLA